MSNHFPSSPDNLELTSVTYYVEANIPGSTTFAALNVAGVVNPVQATNSALAVNTNPQNGTAFAPVTVQFQFTTPGSAGSFDQDAEEAVLQEALGSFAQMISALNGVDLATAAGYMTVTRYWEWQDPTGKFTLAYSDVMS